MATLLVRFAFVLSAALLWAAAPAAAQSGEICPELCRDEVDCPEGEICYPPTDQCQPPCQIACLVPDPVCGDDGVTYFCGEADANCNGAEVVSEGPCDRDCICPRIYAPVCGEDGVTYANACEARCAEVEVAHEGTCREPPCRGNEDCGRGEICYPPTDQCQSACQIACVAPDPVCGDDGVTYFCGEPDAHCNGAEVAFEGPCEAPCVCPQVYAPVCGADGETYPNACQAQCAGTEVASEGGCEAEPECSANGDCPDGEICYPPTLECRPPCSIACFVADPVCGSDGETYFCGEPDAHCNGATVEYDGACETCTEDTDCARGDVCDDGECVLCACPQVYAPVCGADGQTYANACFASCAHVEVAFEGECGSDCRDDADCPLGQICGESGCQPCVCPDVYDPVCGVDGTTYGNTCEARCARVEIAFEGECRSECRDDADCAVGRVCDEGSCEICACPQIYDPVCGVDGSTYANACFARCAHVPVRYEGECLDRCRNDGDCPRGTVCEGGQCLPCVCPDVYDPVCGEDGQTYGNTCEARCAGVPVAHEGECVLPGCFEDTDGDGSPDAEDNCTLKPNGPDAGPNDQVDSDGDGYGDVCDCDFTGDGFCNVDDFLVFLPDFRAGTPGSGTDMTGDGFVNVDDFLWFVMGFMDGRPGPAAGLP